MARTNTKSRSRTRKKASATASTASLKIDVEIMYDGDGTNVPAHSATWLQQFEEAAAGSADAASLDRERKAQEILTSLEGTIAELRKNGNSLAREQQDAQKRQILQARQAELRAKGEVFLATMRKLAAQGSIIASGCVGANLLNDIVRQGNGRLEDEETSGQIRTLLTFAADKDYPLVFTSLAVFYRAMGEQDRADAWLARGVEAGIETAILMQGETLLQVRPVPAEEMTAILQKHLDLALQGSWTALQMLAQVCKARAYNKTVQAFAKKPLDLLQQLATQGYEPAMIQLGDYYNSITSLTSNGMRMDSKAARWYDMAIRNLNAEAVLKSVESSFFGPEYTGVVHKVIPQLAVHMLQGEGDERIRCGAMLGRLVRPMGNMDTLLPIPDMDSDTLLLNAARAGYSEQLCKALRAEIIWEDHAEYRGDTILDDPSLDKDPAVLFTRGQTMLNFPPMDGDEDDDHKFRQKALENIQTAANNGYLPAIGWLCDGLLRGLYGLRQNTETGLQFLQTGLQLGIPRAITLEALRQLGWIPHVPGEEKPDMDWILELFGWAASQDDCAGYAGLLVVQGMEAITLAQQKALGADMAKFIMIARSRADASALYLLGCLLAKNGENANLKQVCKQSGNSMKGGFRHRENDEHAYILATSTVHSAYIVGEPKGEMIANLVQPGLGNLERVRSGEIPLDDFI